MTIPVIAKPQSTNVPTMEKHNSRSAENPVLWTYFMD